MPIRAFPLELKTLSAEGTFEGMASVYNVKDQGGDVVTPGAFETTIKQQGTQRPLLYGHSDVIGTVDLVDTPTGLAVKGTLALGVQRARDTYELLKAGAVKGLSIGFQSIPGSDEMRSGIRYLTNLKLFEVSLTAFPMNEAALVTSVKSLARDEEEKNRQILRDFHRELRQELTKGTR